MPRYGEILLLLCSIKKQIPCRPKSQGVAESLRRLVAVRQPEETGALLDPLPLHLP